MPALVTPFTKDGDFIEDGLRQVIEYTIQKGVSAIVPGGTTGEFVYMRTEERKKLLRLAVEFADGRVPVVAGTGQNSTRATLALTKYAADIGCQAALVVSPFYLRPSDRGYYEHYETVARQSDLPIILYNIPQCTLGQLSVNVVEDLAEIDNIVAVKDSSGNIPYTMELIQKLSGKLPVLIGNDECVLAAITAGASGAILASANIIPHIWIELIKCVQQGNIARAAELQRSAQTLARIISKHGGAAAVKAALRYMGIDAGRSRLPLDSGGTLTAEVREEIRVELESLGLISRPVGVSTPSVPPIGEVLSESGVSISLEGIRTGSGSSDRASVTVAAGPKGGPLGRALVRLLVRPRVGREALTVILEPNLPVRPISIMLPARRVKSLRQASMIYGPAQSGAARAIASALSTGRIPKESVENDVMVLVVDMDLDSKNRRELTASVETATMRAIEAIWR